MILDRVVVSYPAQLHPALGPLDLTIREGECVFITGPNGSGKTTLARVLSGVMQLTSGRITNGAGEDIADWAPGYVGWVQQNPIGQMVGTTVAEDISLGPRWLSSTLDQVRRKTSAALTEFRLESKGNQSIHALSGGWQHQVALAAVWAQDPGIIILDEPDTMLDRHGLGRLMRWIQHLRQRGSTLLILGHNPRWMVVADRTAVLDHGVWAHDPGPIPIPDQEWVSFVDGVFGDNTRNLSVCEVSERIWPGQSAR